MSAAGTHGICGGCDRPSYLIPLHGDRGGPLRCLLCIGEWNALYTRRHKWGRIVIKAIKLFLKNGGKYRDLDTLKVQAYAGDDLGYTLLRGYEDHTVAEDVGDITSELLAATLQLVHPDHHPPGRRELATRVTQELLALKPFVFPAPKPAPEPVVQPPRDASFRSPAETSKKPSQIYPCELCAEGVPYFYCDPCKAEWNKRQQVERERDRAKQRKWYAWRKARRERERSRPLTLCAACGAQFKGKRKDARFCSAACRQRAHRKSVTANSLRRGGEVISRYGGAAS